MEIALILVFLGGLILGASLVFVFAAAYIVDLRAENSELRATLAEISELRATLAEMKADLVNYQPK